MNAELYLVPTHAMGGKEIEGTVENGHGHVLKINPYHNYGGWGGIWWECSCGVRVHTDGYGHSDGDEDDPADSLHSEMMEFAREQKKIGNYVDM